MLSASARTKFFLIAPELARLATEAKAIVSLTRDAQEHCMVYNFLSSDFLGLIPPSTTIFITSYIVSSYPSNIVQYKQNQITTLLSICRTLYLGFAVLPQGEEKWCEFETNACRDVQENGEHISVQQKVGQIAMTLSVHII